MSLVAAALGTMLSTGCSITRPRTDAAPADSAPQAQPRPTPPPETEAQRLDRLQAQLDSMSARLLSLESRLGSLAAKAAATRKEADELVEARKPRPEPVSSSPADHAGSPILSASAASRAGFVSDDAIQQFREGMILYESRNYSDAILAFSGFIDHYPDHPLAGSAQYYLGESYYKQNEFKLASREFHRVLTSYDRSVHIADALKDLADSEDRLQDPEDARRHREMLATILARSPAAGSISQSDRTDPASTPQASTPQASTPLNTAAPASGAENPSEESSPEPQGTPPGAPEAAPSPGQDEPSIQSRYDAPPETAPTFTTINNASPEHAAHP